MIIFLLLLNLKKLILKNYNINCIQIFSYDAIVPYLIKKKLYKIQFFISCFIKEYSGKDDMKCPKNLQKLFYSIVSMNF